MTGHMGKELRIRSLVRGNVATNCYIVIEPESKEAVIIDCEGTASDYADYLEKEGLTLSAILLTHGHFDHIGAVKAMKERYPQVPVYVSRIDEPMLGNPMLNASRLFGMGEVTAAADRTLEDKEKLSLLGTEIEAILTPGHTAGGMCFYFPEEGLLFAGDTLFYYGMGRSDLPTGDEEALLRSIRERLFTLPENVKVFPGHGPTTSIGREKDGNPYF